MLLLLALLALPSPAPAQCRLAGEGRVDGVRPTGTTLSVGLDEELEVTLRGTRADVRGIAPVELSGRARARDVHVRLAVARRAHGVLALAAGAEVRVLRERGGRAHVRLDGGAVRIHLDVPCADLGLGRALETSAEVPIEGELAGVRGSTLSVFPTASGGRPLVLRARGGSFPVLDVVERRGRWRVRAELAPGVLIDGWVDRGALSSTMTVWSDDHSGTSGGGCGWSYAGERHRGPATIVAGTALLDEHGVIAARTITDVHAVIAIAGFTYSTRRGTPDGTVIVETTEDRTVYVDRMDALIAPPCRPLGFVVDEGAIRTGP